MTDHSALMRALIDIERELGKPRHLDSEVNAYRTALGRALLYVKCGIGSIEEVATARKALKAATASAEQDALDHACMVEAMPRLKEEISTKLQALNAESRTQRLAKDKATYTTALKKFDRDLTARRIRRDDMSTVVKSMRELAAKAKMTVHFREYLDERSGVLQGFDIS